MALSSNDHEFWDRVEHEMKVKQPSTWRISMLLLRLGIAGVLFSSAYVLFFYILRPAKGYFFTVLESSVSPIFWVLICTIFIICGAFLRFRAMGPIVDKFKAHGIH
jgi:hypothetical protein